MNMFDEYMDSFYEIYRAPFWLLIVALGLFMIFYDSPKLMSSSKSDASMIKTIGWAYIVVGSLIFIFIKILR